MTPRQLVFNFVKARPLLCGGVLTVLLVVVWQIAGGIIFGIKSAHVDRQVSHVEAQAAQAEAATQEKAADASEITRKVEDEVREQVIAPTVQATTRRTREAQTKYDTAKNTRHVDAPDSALHAANCRALADLYPGESFARCQ